MQAPQQGNPAAAAQQQQQQAQLAVSQAMQQAMQQRQQGQASSGQALTEMAMNYMNVVNAANYAKSGAAGAGAVGLNPALLSSAAASAAASQQQQQGVGGQTGSSMTWDPRLSYPMMYNINPTLLALQQQQAAQRSALHQGGYMVDPNMLLSQQSQLGMDSRKSRHIKSPSQLKALKLFFVTNQRPSKEEIRKLVKETGLPHQEVTRWFRNERHKEKKQQEAKLEALQGHLKNQGAGMHGLGPQFAAHAAQQLKKRKREDGQDDTDGEDQFGMQNMGGPQQRIQFIQSFIASLSDPSELEAAEKTLEARRMALGIAGGDANPNAAHDAVWHVLQQSFHAAAMKIEGPDAKRRKIKNAEGQEMDSSVVSGLTQMLARHPEYFREVQKNLTGQQ